MRAQVRGKRSAHAASERRLLAPNYASHPDSSDFERAHQIDGMVHHSFIGRTAAEISGFVRTGAVTAHEIVSQHLAHIAATGDPPRSSA